MERSERIASGKTGGAQLGPSPGRVPSSEALAAAGWPPVDPVDDAPDDDGRLADGSAEVQISPDARAAAWEPDACLLEALGFLEDELKACEPCAQRDEFDAAPAPECRKTRAVTSDGRPPWW
jgi:hypothetical protein